MTAQMRSTLLAEVQEIRNDPCASMRVKAVADAVYITHLAGLPQDPAHGEVLMQYAKNRQTQNRWGK